MKMRIDGGEQPVLARHVVSRRRDRAERRAAHYEFTLAQPDAVGQIRMTAGKLRDLDPRVAVQVAVEFLRQTLAEISLQRFPIHFFAPPHPPPPRPYSCHNLSS